MGTSVFRPQVPQYSQLAQAKAQTIGNIFSTAIPAAAESVQLYMANRDKNKIFDAYRQTILNPKNMEEMGLDEAKAQAFAGRLKPRSGESVEDYEKRVSPVMWNIKYWDQAGREAGVPLDDPFISSALFKGTVDDALERIGAERVRAGTESGQITTQEQAVAAQPNATGSQLAQALPSKKEKAQEVQDRLNKPLVDAANSMKMLNLGERSPASMQQLSTDMKVYAESLKEQQKELSQLEKDFLNPKETPTGTMSQMGIPVANKYGITSMDDLQQYKQQVDMTLARASEMQKVADKRYKELVAEEAKESARKTAETTVKAISARRKQESDRGSIRAKLEDAMAEKIKRTYPAPEKFGKRMGQNPTAQGILTDSAKWNELAWQWFPEWAQQLGLPKGTEETGGGGTTGYTQPEATTTPYDPAIVEQAKEWYARQGIPNPSREDIDALISKLK